MPAHTLTLPEVDLVYDVDGPLPTADGRRPLLMIGQPMTADGFAALASHFGDRTVVRYDPRGLGRSTTRRDGRTDQNSTDQTADLHALVEHLGAGPVDVFASSGGAVTSLIWAATHPGDIHTLVAHEPPSLWTLPDADAAERGFDRVRQVYADRGMGAGMAAFIAMTSWPGEFTDEFFAQPLPDPAAFGMPAEDDGTRDDPLLSHRAVSVPTDRYDTDSLTTGPVRVVMAVGEETGPTFTGRTTAAVAELIGVDPVIFPGGHGGFGGEDDPWPGQATAFAVVLKDVLRA